MTVNTGILFDAVKLGVLAKVTSDISENLVKPKKRSGKKRKVKQNTYGDWW